MKRKLRFKGAERATSPSTAIREGARTETEASSLCGAGGGWAAGRQGGEVAGWPSLPFRTLAVDGFPIEIDVRMYSAPFSRLRFGFIFCFFF